MTYTVPGIADDAAECIEALEEAVAEYLRGEMASDEFRRMHVPMGIYQQRDGAYMVRVRAAGGAFLPRQADMVAGLSEAFGSGTIHVTTRQDLQIHGVGIESIARVLRQLLTVGLSTRGGGGDTVRNVTTCALSGVCRDQLFDVTPHAHAVSGFLGAYPDSFNLPRKFKVGFSGCSKDCGLCAVADLGFIARKQNGDYGFRVRAGGGMGANSALAIDLEEFVPHYEVCEVAEAVKRLFARFGDRQNRRKARLRYVVERTGADEFRRLYRQELDPVRRDSRQYPRPELLVRDPDDAQPPARQDRPSPYRLWRASYVLQQRDGLFAVLVQPPLGEVSSHSLKAIARRAARVGGAIRATQDQGLQIRGVPAAHLYRVFLALRRCDDALVASESIRCVCCVGAATCRLGICNSRGLARAIQERLTDVEAGFGATIRISGCPNSCGQHPIASLGLFGGAAGSDGRRVPVYTIVVGGKTGDAPALAQSVGRVPARVVPELLREFVFAAARERAPEESFDDLLARWGADYLRRLAAGHEAIPPDSEAPQFYEDYT